jgi:hypothetical protein
MSGFASIVLAASMSSSANFGGRLLSGRPAGARLSSLQDCRASAVPRQ